jgi:hypothetical protein
MYKRRERMTQGNVLFIPLSPRKLHVLIVNGCEETARSSRFASTLRREERQT